MPCPFYQFQGVRTNRVSRNYRSDRSRKTAVRSEKMEDRFQVGIISSTHGIGGEVKVYPTTDDVKRFRKLKQVILDTGREELTLEIERVRFFKQMVILKFREFQNINEVERFRGKSLYVTRENAVKLQKDEYFIADMIGMKVVSTEGEELGELTDVLQTGANDVYVVKKRGSAGTASAGDQRLCQTGGYGSGNSDRISDAGTAVGEAVGVCCF